MLFLPPLTEKPLLPWTLPTSRWKVRWRLLWRQRGAVWQYSKQSTAHLSQPSSYKECTFPQRDSLTISPSAHIRTSIAYPQRLWSPRSSIWNLWQTRRWETTDWRCFAKSHYVFFSENKVYRVSADTFPHIQDRAPFPQSEHWATAGSWVWLKQFIV